tara:strand:- start:1131 stop:1829 length:699 start_codon:yes stop_codon:yes gene_type:complete
MTAIKHPAQNKADPLAKAAAPPVEPFRFMTEAGVVLWTGYIADSLPSLARGLLQVPGSSIYYHVHHAIFRRRKHRLAEHTNDFARWVSTRFGLKGLSEKLSSLDPLECSTIRESRERLVAFVQEYVGEGEAFPRVPLGWEFYFLEARSFVFPAGAEAADVEQLAEGVEKMGLECILHHLVEARFRDGGGTNDFSRWLRLWQENEKAEALERLNPYFHDLRALKDQIGAVLRG